MSFSGGWLNQQWYIYTLKFYPAVKSNEERIHVATWINFQRIMLSEKSQATQIIHCMIPFNILEMKKKTKSWK